MTRLSFQNKTLLVADESIQKLLVLSERAAKSQAPVLIYGESGTGKELIARFIHEKSVRKNGPFISINCAAIPEGLLEAELFGFERGAFTGAVASHVGKFERANSGTLLLDEISEMPLLLQAKLLRALQEGEIDRLGGKHSIRVSPRIVATTNQDPRELVESHKFREDLFFRLNVIRMDCVPLRGRRKAIRGLVTDFLEDSLAEHRRESVKISNELLERLSDYHWPGNVRELKNAIERAVFLCEGDELFFEHFDFLKGPDLSEKGESLEAVERNHILYMLQKTGGNRTLAATELGITTRTLRNKLKIYKLSETV